MNFFGRSYIVVASFVGVFLIQLLSSSPIIAQSTNDTHVKVAGGTLPSHIAIKVENETVPMDRFQKKVDALFDDYKEKAEKRGRDYDPDRVRNGIQKKVKSRILSRLLLNIYSQRSDVTVPEERFQKQWKRTLEKAGSEEEYQKKLEEQGSSLKQAKEEIRNHLKKLEYVRQNTPKVTVTDTEIKEVYTKNKKRFQNIDPQRASRFIRKKIMKRKENQASKVLIADLKKKADVRIHPEIDTQ
jgi:FKBP-type peptidyl-prolyl cis-trans isomerase (trigger factor)